MAILALLRTTVGWAGSGNANGAAAHTHCPAPVAGKMSGLRGPYLGWTARWVRRRHTPGGAREEAERSLV